MADTDGVAPTVPDDARWEWMEIRTFGGGTHWIKGRCRHTEVVPVDSAGLIIAHLCRTCDQQLPEEWHG